MLEHLLDMGPWVGPIRRVSITERGDVEEICLLGIIGADAAVMQEPPKEAAIGNVDTIVVLPTSHAIRLPSHIELSGQIVYVDPKLDLLARGLVLLAGLFPRFAAAEAIDSVVPGVALAEATQTRPIPTAASPARVLPLVLACLPFIAIVASAAVVPPRVNTTPPVIAALLAFRQGHYLFGAPWPKRKRDPHLCRHLLGPRVGVVGIPMRVPLHVGLTDCGHIGVLLGIGEVGAHIAALAAVPPFARMALLVALARLGKPVSAMIVGVLGGVHTAGRDSDRLAVLAVKVVRAPAL
mmetsp:Transcript_51337/g.164122  ORF Transcript_51337/g.164122 Transcript_51337/m.164122 type:complete len:295 (-) Transcript_51337:254-1138(-)